MVLKLIRLHALGEVITWVGYRIITLVASGTEPFKLSAGIREDKESKQSHPRLIYNLDRNSDRARFTIRCSKYNLVEAITLRHPSWLMLERTPTNISN